MPDNGRLLATKTYFFYVWVRPGLVALTPTLCNLDSVSHNARQTTKLPRYKIAKGSY